MSLYTVLLCVIFSLVAPPVSPTVKSKQVSRDGTEVGIHDELFTAQHLVTIADFFGEVSWEFRTNLTESVCADCLRSFQSPLPLHSFVSSPTWERIKSAVKETDKEVFPRTVQGRILLPGEQSLSQTCSESQKHVVIVFWSQQREKNSYGEFVVFDKDGEVALSVRPKLGRTLVLQCPVQFLAHSPSNVGHRLRFLEITTTSSKDLFEEKSSQQKTMFTSRELNYVQRFILLNSPENMDAPSDQFDLSTKLTHRYTTTSGKPVLVFDGLLQRTYIEKLFDMMYHGIYHDQPAGSDSTDNVQWVLAVETVPFLQTGLWTLVKQVVQYASGEDTFYPYDVSCNHIQMIDRTKFHRDCGKYDDEYTFMVYLNPNWTANHYGETIFLNDDGEMLAAITPKHGRVVIFHGTVLHSARPPSPAFQGVRYTFVVKMTSTQEKAFQKFAHSELSDKDEDDDDDDVGETAAVQQLRKEYYGANEKQLNIELLQNSEFLQNLQEMERQIQKSLTEM